MSLRTSQKMYLLSPHQLERLSRPDPGIREKAEHELDSRMKTILEDRTLNQYEKIKKYQALLQRYLELLKQKEPERVPVMLTTPQEHRVNNAPVSEVGKKADATAYGTALNEEEGEKEEEGKMRDGYGDGRGDIVHTIPIRYRKNAEYVLRKLSSGEIGWTPRNEFIFKGRPVRGSHMTDLLKNLVISGGRKKKTSQQEPRGWTEFLHTLAELNIPETTVSSPHAREQLRRVKNEGAIMRQTGDEEDFDGGSYSAKKKKRRKNHSPSGVKWVRY